MLIAQISDCHLVEPGGRMADRADPADGLRRAVDLVNALEAQPDVVLATGDLVNNGSPAQYEYLASILDDLAAPLVPIPGNHDDRTGMRRSFAQLPPGDPSEPIDFVVDEHELRLICLDTSIPGRNDGRLAPEQTEWLDRQLADSPDRPTVIVQHHPPFRSGIPWMDDSCGFEGAVLEASVVQRYRNVEALVCGHYHRAIHRRFGGTVASSCPSTVVQLALLLGDGQPHYTDEPAAIALHHYNDSGLNSHLVPIVDAERWVPTWGEAP